MPPLEPPATGSMPPLEPPATGSMPPLEPFLRGLFFLGEEVDKEVERLKLYLSAL
jgi:hypothetical protein